MLQAPFSPRQVKRINAYQASGVFQGLTCSKRHQNRTLVARVNGLFCPDSGCDYEQNWAPAFADDPRWERRVSTEEGQ